MEQLKSLLDELQDIEIKINPAPFNMLSIAYQDITRKERLHSKLLAGLVNPKESHGLNSLCLETFLKHIGADFENKFIGSVSITTERNVGGRFIDIFIEWKDDNNKKYAIIIENKLHDAPDQENQLNDYYKGICKEGYIVEKVVYMPSDKSYKLFKGTVTTDEIIQKCKDFDAEDIVKWLEETISIAPKEKNSILIQYKEFFECLINKNFIYMKAANDIFEKVSSIEDISKLENLAEVICSNEWVQAFFNPITKNLQKRFGDNLKVGYRYKTETVANGDCVVYYVQYWFEPKKYWLELGKHEDGRIVVYLCSYSSNDGKPTVLANETFRCDDIEDNPYYCNIWYYTWENRNDCFFEYLPFDEEKSKRLSDAIIPILEDLSKYKEE